MLHLVLIIAQLVSIQPPGSYQRLDSRTTQPLIVKASFEPGANLPQVSECLSPQTICTDPPPFWMATNVLSVVYGDLTTKTIPVVTIDHYGMDHAIKDDKSPSRLILILRKDNYFAMPRYAQTLVITNRSGRDYIPLTSPNPIWWLPCAVEDLKEPLNREDFSGPEWSAEELNRFIYRYDASLFSSSGRKAFPKYGIPVDQISKYLATIKPNTAQITCGREI